MEKVFVTVIESDGRNWEHDTEITVFAKEEDAEAFLKVKFNEAKQDVDNVSDNTEIEYFDSDSFAIQGDDYEYWVSGYVSEKTVN